MEQANQLSQLPASKIITEISSLNFQKLKDGKELESILENFAKSGSDIGDKTIEELKKSHSLDDNSVLEMLKNSKQLSAEKMAQIEKVFNSKGEKIPESALTDALTVITELTKKEKSFLPQKITPSSSANPESDDNMDSEDDSDSQSREGQNLVDSVKENLDHLLNSNKHKRKATNKRWWTPEEVSFI